jgi:hypothetical protein
VRRGLPAGRYGLTLTAGRRSTHRTITIR